MAIVSVDTQRRIYLPKGLDFKAKKAIIVPRGETYVIIPVPDDITPIDMDATIEELKQGGEEKARNLKGYGIGIVPVDDDTIWREAAKIKAGHLLSLADVFAAATAREKKVSLLVGRGPEFDGLGVPLERIT